MRKWAGQALTAFRRLCTESAAAGDLQRQKFVIRSTAAGAAPSTAGSTSIVDALNELASPAHRTIIFDELFLSATGPGLGAKNRGSRAAFL